MISTTPTALAHPGLRFALGVFVALLLSPPSAVDAQGWFRAFSREPSKATRRPDRSVAYWVAQSAVSSAYSPACLALETTARRRAASGTKQPGSAKTAKAGKSGKATKPPTVLTQEGEPQLSAEQIVANSDANIDRIKAELNLTPEQEKNWTGFNSAMHYLGHNGADRLNLRIARAKRDPPDDIIEQMRNEAQFLNDRSQDQRNVADAAEPLFASLDDKQKAIFIQEMVRLSHERGLD